MKKADTLLDYPNISKFISALAERRDTFLYDCLDTADYGFWPHLEYFIINMQRFGDYESIIEKLSIVAPLKMDIQQAWEKWRQFRSAQSEVTSIFIIENYFKGQVLEIIPVKKKRTPDIRIKLATKEYLIEIKAQSGQQHGSKHPRAKGLNYFSPDFELDLKSWLFEENISSRTGKPMKPKTVDADEQGAEILMAMTDHFTRIQDIKKQVSILCPRYEFCEKREIIIESLEPCVAHFFKVIFPVKDSLRNLKEIWLYNESHLDRLLALSREESLLIDHLNNVR